MYATAENPYESEDERRIIMTRTTAVDGFVLEHGLKNWTDEELRALSEIVNREQTRRNSAARRARQEAVRGQKREYDEHRSS